MGVMDAEFPNLEHCVQDGAYIVNDIKKATDFLKTKDVKKIVNGLKILGDAIKHISSAVKDCKGVTGDFEKLEETAAIFSNPESVVIHIGKDLIIHGKNIFSEVNGAIKAYDKKDFYHFGFNIGKAASQILIGEAYDILLEELQKPEVQKGMLAEAAKTMPTDASR